MVAVVFLWCQALEVVVVFWERPVAAVVGAAGGAALDCRVRGVVPRRRALGCDSAACFASAVPKQQQPRPFVGLRSWRAAHASLLHLCAGAED